jgi:hypothetical protein
MENSNQAEPVTVQLNCEIPLEIHRQLSHLSVEKRIPRNRIVAAVLAEYLASFQSEETHDENAK